MSGISRRTMITRGLAAAAGLTGLAAAERLADRYGLIPPDHGGLYGAGETLTYAAQRVLTRHSLAREFSRSQISHPPFADARNDGDLPVAFGGPLRLRVPRQLGYKSVKFINRIAVTDSLKPFGKGLGSASPEGGYAWYAGI